LDALIGQPDFYLKRLDEAQGPGLETSSQVVAVSGKHENPHYTLPLSDTTGNERAMGTSVITGCPGDLGPKDQRARQLNERDYGNVPRRCVTFQLCRDSAVARDIQHDDVRLKSGGFGNGITGERIRDAKALIAEVLAMGFE
jgi:hypothetical protein